MSKVNSVKVMVGLKGSSYTNQFLVLWTMTLNHFWKNTNSYRSLKDKETQIKYYKKMIKSKYLSSANLDPLKLFNII